MYILDGRRPALTMGAIFTLLGAAACGGGGATSTAGTGGTGGTGPTTGTGGTTSTTTMTATGGGGTGGGGSVGDVGSWTDAPGACPAGMPQVDLHTAAELASASRGEDAYAGDAPATCYFLHDGTYTQSGVVGYFLKGGTPGARRVFVGESRSGVILRGRATIEDGTSDLTITNLTFDLTGYQQSGAFNTLGVGNGKNITVDHVTFTGDCATGLQGGHIETNGVDGLLVEACLIEKFGHCGGGGHEDHGVYLASGKNLTLRNNVIRGNASRGIQLYTQGGEYGTLDGITIERNLIQENGHADYEDGIVINGSGTGPISNVVVQRNVFAKNYYAGIRFAGDLESGVTITRNTFWNNGAGSTAAGRSEINVDDMGDAVGASIGGNLFDVGNTLVNNCYDGTAHAFMFGDNFVHGTVPSGAAGNCVGSQTLGDPMLASPATGDFHPNNAAAATYGAYAP